MIGGSSTVPGVGKMRQAGETVCSNRGSGQQATLRPIWGRRIPDKRLTPQWFHFRSPDL